MPIGILGRFDQTSHQVGATRRTARRVMPRPWRGAPTTSPRRRPDHPDRDPAARGAGDAVAKGVAVQAQGLGRLLPLPAVAQVGHERVAQLGARRGRGRRRPPGAIRRHAPPRGSTNSPGCKRLEPAEHRAGSVRPASRSRRQLRRASRQPSGRPPAGRPRALKRRRGQSGSRNHAVVRSTAP